MNLVIKNPIKTATLLFCMLLITVASHSVLAKSGGTDRVTEKARQAVEQASPDDWMTYAKNAELCIRKNVNLKEAAEWLDQSLNIKETAYNLKIKGLYYEKNNLPKEALLYYIKSLKTGIEQDINYTDPATQQKVAALNKA